MLSQMQSQFANQFKIKTHIVYNEEILIQLLFVVSKFPSTYILLPYIKSFPHTKLIEHLDLIKDNKNIVIFSFSNVLEQQCVNFSQ